MRFLHTSDWHLGRSFHREDLLAAQAAFVDHLVATAAAERVDCVLISGDVYDRALPPVDAVRLCDEALRRLAALTRVVLIAGNHDSARRLGFGAELMDDAGVHIRTDFARVGEPVIVGDAAVYGIPYLEPELVRHPWDLDERSHAAALTEAMRRIRADAAGRAERPVVLAHAFVTGGEASESERDISVGGSSQVAASVFEGADYAALGHLHGRWSVTDRVRYSGSPLAYSFSEADHVKGSWLVELRDGAVAAEFVEAPVPRRLARLKGRLDDLLTDPSHEPLEDRWLQVTLTDPRRPSAAMERLRRRFPHALVLGFEPEGGGTDGARTWSERVRERSALEIADDFVAEVTDGPATEAERALLHEAFEHCRRREALA
ncbi:exonuclease SbcCD subunit D [Actinomadura livida]|uniref:Nuclease SbcCD subunit D n=1 Tax=Actinomadura livida TaxID=79909 RepID=A0A7W7IC26_9ACTN|nr:MULTISPECIES: exonuclease SbcCD subunit D [Actinomadura]MBB4774325.1 exonuclease SbcD [Actinomadura catellatispora]GGT83379.1 nuclease SbcCD subunit D [Actinomadura livida]